MAATTQGDLALVEDALSARSVQVARNTLASAGRTMAPEYFRTTSPRPVFTSDDILFVDQNGLTAGLAMRSDILPGDQTRGDAAPARTAFLFARFVHENGVWKHDGSLTRYVARSGPDGQDVTFDRAWIRPDLAVDGIIQPTPEALPLVDPDLVGAIGYRCSQCSLQISVNGELQEPGPHFIPGGLRPGENTLDLTLVRPDTLEPGANLLRVSHVRAGAAGGETLLDVDLAGLANGEHRFTFQLAR